MSDIKDYLAITSLPLDPGNELEINKTFKKHDAEPEVAIFDTFVAEEMFR